MRSGSKIGLRSLRPSWAIAYHEQMEIDPEFARKALQAGLEKYPRFAENGPRLAARALFQGHTYILEYDRQPARDDPDAWEFQNAVVKGYRQLVGV